jgi:hypothetical protein
MSDSKFIPVFRAEMDEIRDRHDATGRKPIPIDTTTLVPTADLALTALACSGGGIRSASFCLGVLQGLQSKDVIKHIDYLSTVSGGGYVGTTMTIGMSSNGGEFPFSRIDELRETPEVRHLRDNSRYLLQNGLPSAFSAAAIYLRGIAMNVLVLLPLLLIAAAIVLSVNPDAQKPITQSLLDGLGFPVKSRVPLTLLLACLLAGGLVLYAFVVSVLRIAPIKQRRLAATIVTSIIFIGVLLAIVELHSALLTLIVDANKAAKPADQSAAFAVVPVFAFIFGSAKAFVLGLGSLVVAALPFLKRLTTKAAEGNVGTWGDFAQRNASRAILIVAALVLPVLIWLITMQIAYWGVDLAADGGPRWKIPIIYLLAGIGLFVCWPFLSVNANSLHQLYRDRLGSAFLIRRRTPKGDEVDGVDDFRLTQIDPTKAPYHLINTALNVPGSKFANRRGRNADFFLFSRCYIGSEATGYVQTNAAEKAVDGLNIGTAMAISGAAAAPNMGMASVRPLSPTIAFLNVRLGRWVRHPGDIARRIKKLEGKHQKLTEEKYMLEDEQRKVRQVKGQAPPDGKKLDKQKGKLARKAARLLDGEFQLQRIPGPLHLLLEAFSKSGRSVSQSDGQIKDSGFVFLTDGGHVDNLGIYELLRRRCRLIIAIDGEADPDLDAASLVQVERFARIDLNVRIRMDWRPLSIRTRAVSDQMRSKALKAEKGPHVALGMIDYPPPADGKIEREKGVLVYIKASLSGDENDYVTAYKAAYPRFPHETTADQLFSEEQFEAYRALGEHIASRFMSGADTFAAFADDRDELLGMVRAILPEMYR